MLSKSVVSEGSNTEGDNKPDIFLQPVSGNEIALLEMICCCVCDLHTQMC